MLPQESYKLDINIPAKMRDGVILYSDVYRPNARSKYPAILIRTPYNKSRSSINFQQFIRAGYALAIQDCRGTGASEGEYYPWRDDTNDGYDAVEWLAGQSWCDGNVGMMGASNVGSVQWLAASTQPPHLKAISPTHTSSGLPFPRKGYLEWGAALGWYVMQTLSWVMRSKLSPADKKTAMEHLSKYVKNMQEQLFFLPLKDVPATKISGVTMSPFLSDWLIHLNDAQYWEQLGSPAHIEKIKVPALLVVDWYHPAMADVLRDYETIKEKGEYAFARQNLKLILGAPMSASMSDAMEPAGVDIIGTHIRWFDHWLKGINNGIMDEPRVRIFVMGDNVWRNENEWPLVRTAFTKYYFHSSGRANSRFGDGTLDIQPPRNNEPSDNYLYNPRNPVPTKGTLMGNISAEDQQEVEDRSDILVYTSAPLQADLEVTGPLEVKLYAASSVVDTDFTGKLVDVWPDGKALNLNTVEGIIRTRYRKSQYHPLLIKPGKIYEYSIKLGATSNVFKTGHRIRVEISSSNFPKYDRNQNMGHIIGQDSEMKVALQTIQHNILYPSHIVLPIIPR